MLLRPSKHTHTPKHVLAVAGTVWTWGAGISMYRASVGRPGNTLLNFTHATQYAMQLLQPFLHSCVASCAR
jgi:hypothetical protein